MRIACPVMPEAPKTRAVRGAVVVDIFVSFEVKPLWNTEWKIELSGSSLIF